MKVFKFALPALLLFGGLVATTSISLGKPEYSKKEKTSCVTCHVKAGKKDLNKTGDYYHENKKMPPKQ